MPILCRVGCTVLGAALLALGLGAPAAADDGVTVARAIAEFGTPDLPEGFAHWPYADPAAPKGGSVTLGTIGSFDSLNTYILRGNWPAGIGLIGDALMTGSADDLLAAYGLIAETVEYPADRSWIIFNLRPAARWHDGHPITADDFLFAYETIRDHGRPFLQSAYQDVEAFEVLGPHRFRISVKTRNRMKPLVRAAGLSPLPRHWWQADGRDITKTTLEPILSSGPYRIKEVEHGRSITYERVPDYWARDLPVNRGLWNFDEIRYDYYRDDTVLFEAFLSGRIDWRGENRAQRWVTGYEVPEVEDGLIIKRQLPNNAPSGFYGLVFNLRRPLFQDIRVRRALNLLFDFESIQRTVLFGLYRRIESWFPNSDYGAGGPPTPEEVAILEPFRDQLAPEVLTRAFAAPRSDGRGANRANRRAALRLLRAAGWESRDGRLVNRATGAPLAFEVLLFSPTLVRVVEPYVQALARDGIDADIRVVDTAQYLVRTDEYDFDVVRLFLTFYPPPGPLLATRFHSSTVDVRGQANFPGIKHPVVDALLDRILSAETLPQLKATTRALDRVLLWHDYAIPFWYDNIARVAHWDRFGWPERMPNYATGFPSTWWVDPAKDAAIAAARR